MSNSSKLICRTVSEAGSIEALYVYDAYGNTIEQYNYTYDAVGRRISCVYLGSAFVRPDQITYSYNARSELTNAYAKVDTDYHYGYVYDDIGNRKIAIERGTHIFYMANNLNQYSLINDFVPKFDDDGNQLLIRSSTGVWFVKYNGENRPSQWTRVSDNYTLTMSFDMMGRQVENNGVRSVYDGYLRIVNCYGAGGAAYVVWDPSEGIDTRSVVSSEHSSVFLHMLDGVKNVSEIFGSENKCLSHYVYAPFGAIIHNDSLLNSSNKWRYSCESFDDCIGVYYYNFRHYSTEDGRWFSRDPLVEPDIKNIYSFVANNVINNTDFLGLDVVDDYMERLKDNAAIISQMNCDFLLACDYAASNNQKFNARSVCIRIQRELKKLFPNKGISILKDYTAGGLKKAIDDAKCLCGIVYVGHVGIRSGDKPTRLIFNERSSLVSEYYDSDKEVERIPIADIDSAKFSNVVCRQFLVAVAASVLGIIHMIYGILLGVNRLKHIIKRTTRLRRHLQKELGLQYLAQIERLIFVMDK